MDFFWPVAGPLIIFLLIFFTWLCQKTLLYAIYHALAKSGMGKYPAFVATTKAFFSYHRTQSLETLVKRRKEICDRMDNIIRNVDVYLGGTGIEISRTQIVDDMFQEDSRSISLALEELIRKGYLKRIPKNVPDEVYRRTRRRYVSRTSPLVRVLEKMGIYARAVRSYRQEGPKEWTIRSKKGKRRT